jgi:hypothetical protein
LEVKATVKNVGLTYAPWTTDHHDAQNSGHSSVAYNASYYNGTCVQSVATPGTGFFAATGATSSDGKHLYVAR